jgi:hypothetical protein
MNVLVSYAIENYELLGFEYEGLLRIVEPHCYGRTHKGNDTIRAFQIEGESSDGNLGWKLFDLSKVEKAQLIGTKFFERTGYKKGDKAMKEIYREI